MIASELVNKLEIIENAEQYIKENNLTKLDDQLSKFVKEAIGHREKSHGYEHLYRVSRYAIYIAYSYEFKEDMCYDFIYNVMNVAWLHDLLDHKYPQEYEANYAKMVELLGKNNIIFKIIERISYSRQVKFGNQDWLTEIGEIGIKIRNIVSDADKLDAIGADGLARCKDYITEHNNNLTNREILLEVKKHADDKLNKLAPQFIYTDIGQKIGINEHKTMNILLVEIDHAIMNNHKDQQAVETSLLL
jgi:HD superfamily phosphodiesterase